MTTQEAIKEIEDFVESINDLKKRIVADPKHANKYNVMISYCERQIIELCKLVFSKS